MIFEHAWIFAEWELKSSQFSTAVVISGGVVGSGQTRAVQLLRPMLIITETFAASGTPAGVTISMYDQSSNVLFSTGLFAHANFSTDLVKGRVIPFPELPSEGFTGIYFASSAGTSAFSAGKLQPMIAMDVQSNYIPLKGEAYPT